jgi:hypothetical protein
MSFNKYAAGRKIYGGGRDAPNVGPVSGDGMVGYKQRDLKLKAKRAALLRMLKAKQSGNYMSADWLRMQK